MKTIQVKSKRALGPWRRARSWMTGASVVVVPCHSCHGQFENIKSTYGMGELEVKYLWEIVADALVLPGERS